MSEFALATFRSPAALACFVLTAAVGLGLDLWVKKVAFDHLLISITTTADGMVIPRSETYRFIPGWLHFHVTANQGAVFGKAQGFRWLFITASIAAVGFLVYLFGSSGRHRLYQVILGMLLAGVLGNLYDRAVYGYVRDMIYVLPGRTWPGTEREIFPWIFNIADSYLCVGVFLMIVYMYLHKPAPQNHSSAKPIESPQA